MKKILQLTAVLGFLGLLLSIALENKMQGQDNNEFVIHIAGDILLSRGVEDRLLEYGYDYPYEEVKDLFTTDDLTIANLECPITDAGNAAKKEKRFVFKAHEKNAAALKNAGFDVLNLANNHTMDYLDEGLKDTMDYLDREGVLTVGAGMNAQSDTSLIFEKDGYKIGILAFSAFPTEGFFYDGDAPTISYISIYNTETVAEKIRDLECDFKIVYFHWGVEYMKYKTKKQEDFAHMAVDNGADLVVGAHTHVIGESEIYHGVPIYYSLGNFIFDRQIQKGTDETMILEVILNRDTGIEEITSIPGTIKDAKVLLTRENN